MHSIQQIVSLATTPQLREDLYLTVATRRNGLQPLSKSIQFAWNLSLEAVKLFRYRVNMQQWSAFLEPLLDAAEDVTDPDLFNNVMVNTARLMREVQNLSVQTFQYLCEKLQAAEAEVEAIQRNITVNWRLLASTPPFDFRDFIDKLVRYSAMEPNMATNVVEASTTSS